ncbi:DNA-processing protein DprA [Janthinobacterium fluminis]|uniref:DNA-processing protein DprA n=1 Tax=Janthinobacterium fluminis TaxID=2987524 RepID=A0ABT5K6K9_9BURK|nr:DNA-processing protein DprA [Janthinobacterium fluminis]MDC8760642.1 DNA-processing protein DprA [Janthinobacterium fluminis]
MQATDPQPADGDDDLLHWLRLLQAPGVGPVSVRALLAHFGLPGNIFRAAHAELKALVGALRAGALLATPPGALAAQRDATLAWLERPGNHILTLADTAYPQTLLAIADPPPLLYVQGRCELLAGPALAVVGSRSASAQGVANAGRFAQALSEAGVTIVSGLALGIDTAAHEGGLRGAGSTVAVIGTGADLVYPPANAALARRIGARGCIVSEYPLGLAAAAENFPRRNRLISGLARGVLVVEAAARSGSLITARLAGEQGRDVFAIPGSIHSALAKGCHQLIKQGAKLVETAADVLEELQLPAPPPRAGAPAGPQPHPDLLAALGHDPADVATLAGRAGQAVGAVAGQLLELELAGLVERLPGGLFQRVTR